MANGVGPFGVDPYGNMPGGSLLHWTAETSGAPRSTAVDPSQLLGSSSLSTGDPTLDALLQSQFRSSGPAAGSGFSPGSMAGDSSLIRFSRVHFDQAALLPGVGFLLGRWRAMFTELRSMACRTALQRRHLGRRRQGSASVGAGAQAAAESPAARMLRLGGRLGAGSLGATVLAAPALQGPNAFGGDVNKQMASRQSF